jgi:hypothetical protein
MALYDKPRDPRFDPMNPNLNERSRFATTTLPLIVAAAIAIVLIAMFFPGIRSPIGDTNNAGPAVTTVTPSPAPSTSPVVPTPNPTTEPRPTQAPQP